MNARTLQHWNEKKIPEVFQDLYDKVPKFFLYSYGYLSIVGMLGPRYVLNQLKIFVPVGKDMKIVTPEK